MTYYNYHTGVTYCYPDGPHRTDMEKALMNSKRYSHRLMDRRDIEHFDIVEVGRARHSSGIVFAWDDSRWPLKELQRITVYQPGRGD